MTYFLFTSQLLFIGTAELLLIGGIALLLFGGKKLPEMMRGLGQGVREFKNGMNDDSEMLADTRDEVKNQKKDECPDDKITPLKDSQADNGKE